MTIAPAGASIGAHLACVKALWLVEYLKTKGWGRLNQSGSESTVELMEKISCSALLSSS
jgi:hypothetical protein